ncbi:MAG: sigma-54-dependent Fis family transcriptional regulator, partial [Myxococcales bacterium]|nr:sigma-54-dependent Fis family transcriptional regulator [Myxococcales bacterium]
ESGELQRVGSSKTRHVNVRILSATNATVQQEVAEGRFREDLLYRLNTVEIHIPALRERREDIPLLIDAMLGKLAAGSGIVLSEGTRAALMAHDWPGNVRELRNVIERALALGADPGMLVAPLGNEPVSRNAQLREGLEFEPGVSFRDTKEKWNELFERRYLAWLIRRAEGNISKAARDADMDRKYLHKLLRKYGITAGEGATGEPDDGN